MKRFQGKCRVLCAILTLAATATVARGNLQDESFDYRLLFAFDRLTSFTDVTARAGASVAHPLGSSVNPGAGDVIRSGDANYTFLATTSSNTILTGSGAEVSGESVTAHYRLPTSGTIYGSYIRTDMNNGDTNTGDDYGLANSEWVLGYSHRFSDDISVGIEEHIVQGYLSDKPAATFGVIDRATNSMTYTSDVGIYYSPGQHHWSFGLMGGLGWINSDTHATIFNPLAAPVPFPIEVKDTIFSSDIRLGVGYRPIDQVGIYADWQYRHLGSNKQGDADVGRMYLGVDYFPIVVNDKDGRHFPLALRAGSSIDTDAKANVACGVAWYGFKNILMEFAYAYNNFPEVDKEFGRANVISFSLIYKN